MSVPKVVSKTIERLAQKCGIDAESVEDAYPCTNLQAALIAASLHELGEYVSRFVFDVSATKHDAKAVRTACELLYERNCILRSRFLEVRGRFFQIVAQQPVDWFETDNLRDYLVRDSKKAVVLGQPLARFGWVQDHGKVYMVWSLHHCQYDEWSFDMMMKDLNKYIKHPSEISQRPPFSKFIKALDKLDGPASHRFWKTNLRDIANCRKICPNAVDDAFRTSQSLARSYNVHLGQNCSYQTSELVYCAWSFLLAHFSGSHNVVFGSIMNGRTFDVRGIAKMCGPTLCTVPWLCDIKREESVARYLDKLREMRLEILPYEQTGLLEYRLLTGTAAFDTLLSVRTAQDDGSSSQDVDDLQPEVPDNMDLSHPCLLYFAADFAGGDCSIKASYDERWIDTTLLRETMDAFVLAVETLPSKLDTSVQDFVQSMQLPRSIQLPTSSYDQRRRCFTPENVDLSKLDFEVMNKIQELAKNVAIVKETSTINGDTTLMQLGMDSLKTVMFARQLNDTFRVSVPFKEIAGRGKSLAVIAKCVQNAVEGNTKGKDPHLETSPLDLAKKYENRLNSTTVTRVDTNDTFAKSSAILLTGATGYLGIEILRQCISSRSEDIILLVRCTNAAEGIDRILRSAKIAKWQANEVDLLKDVKIWPSDLSQKNLGLSTDHLRLLTDPDSSIRVKSIIHNGATVDFLQTYEDLEAVNVASTSFLLEQHLRYKNPPNFVYVTGGRPCPLIADEIGETSAKLSNSNGYAQTKFVGEILVHKANELHKAAGRKCRMSIVHPGGIIGGADTGVANTDDLIWRYVAASLSMGCYVPAVPTKRELINLTPADLVAKAVLSCALAAGTPGETSGAERVLVRAGIPTGLFWATVIETLGDNGAVLDPVSEWEWLAEFKTDIDRKGQEQPLFSLSQLFLDGNITGIGGLPPAVEEEPSPQEIESIKAAVRSNLQYLTSIGAFSQIGQGKAVGFSRGKN